MDLNFRAFAFAMLVFCGGNFALLVFHAGDSLYICIFVYCTYRYKRWQPGQDSQNRTTRMGQPEQDSQIRTGRIVQAEQDRQNKTGRTGPSESDCQDRTAQTGLPGLD
jgi:hypothetical protein